MKVAHVLAVESRSKIGSRYAKRERAAGRLPAVMYGHGQPPSHVTVSAHEAIRYIEGGERVFTVQQKGQKDETVILKDLQFDYLGTNIVHLDLARVSLDEKIESKVPVKLVGESIGLKKAGAILLHPTPLVTLRCTVLALPDHVDVDISQLDVDHAVSAAEIKLPAGVELASDPHDIVAAIQITKEEVATAEATAVDGAPAQPEVITAKKPAEGEAAAGDKKGAAPAKDAKGGGDKKK
ncbi:MAG: 50S ribosomal protein L25 [Planctomycetes bacterium]|nr:50S ribosomal protein L25 [Planctomycetota bacterium]